jgi:hypothetical protein
MAGARAGLDFSEGSNAVLRKIQSFGALLNHLCQRGNVSIAPKRVAAIGAHVISGGCLRQTSFRNLPPAGRAVAQTNSEIEVLCQ